MKRRDLIRHLESQGCELLPKGRRHSVYVLRSQRTCTTVPRHREIDEFLVQKICKDLGVSPP